MRIPSAKFEPAIDLDRTSRAAQASRVRDSSETSHRNEPLQSAQPDCFIKAREHVKPAL